MMFFFLGLFSFFFLEFHSILAYRVHNDIERCVQLYLPISKTNELSLQKNERCVNCTKMAHVTQERDICLYARK